MRIPPQAAGSLLIAVFVAGCATLLQSAASPTPEQIAERGLEALARHDYEAAIADLSWVSTYHRDRPVGRQALLALAAAELDPSNPGGRPDVGAELLAAFRAMEDHPTWTVPVANTLRGLLLELRDAQERARVAEDATARADRSARQAVEQASQVRAERTALATRASELERELTRTRHQLARAREEVERIRRTLGN
jgi:hypothetical protein